MTDLEICKAALHEALRAGATAADAVVLEQDGKRVRVREGEVENVEDSRSRAVGVRAYRGLRMGIAYANGATEAAAREAARRAAGLAEVAAEDPSAGLPDPGDLGALDAELRNVDPDFGRHDTERWRELALRAERGGREDPRITMSESSRAGGTRRRVTLANSHGFAASWEHTAAHLSVGVFATGEQGERQRDHFAAAAVRLDELPPAEEVGREAARRAIRRVGWRKPPSGQFPVVLSPDVARDFAQTLAQALSASHVYRRATFLAEDLGRDVASAALTLVDDATLAGRLGSRPFDGEGVRARRTVLLDRGRAASWIADSYSARRTGSTTTGNASRSVGGSTGVGTTNLVLAPGERSPEELIAEVGEGLYVTDLFGFGVNLAAGSWSRGGYGLWIEGGRLAHPVQELTVAGDLREMLRNFREAANDLEWLYGCAAPTVRIDGLTVAAG